MLILGPESERTLVRAVGVYTSRQDSPLHPDKNRTSYGDTMGEGADGTRMEAG